MRIRRPLAVIENATCAPGLRAAPWRATVARAACIPLFAIAGCALQPAPPADEIRAQSMPNVKAPARWTGADAPASPVRDDWLPVVDDASLRALIAEALAYNTDLRLTAARVEEAAAYAKLAGATIYPAVNLLAHGGGKLGGDNSGINGGGLFASWELDLWGRVRAERAAGEEQFQAAERDAEFARRSLVAMVTKSWVLAIEARLQHAIAADVASASGRSLGLAQDRLRIGIGDEYDVSLALGSLQAARDAERQLALAQVQALRALELLVGRYPAATIEVATRLPALPGPVPAGLPSELLERRPDVMAAERRIAAAFHRVEEAKAARLPKIALTAGLTSMSSNLFVLQEHSNPVASLGANLAFPIFNGNALQAQVEIRTAEQAMAVADYGRIGLRAFNEVESALSAAAAADDREVILAQSVVVSSRSRELAEVRYRVGSGDLRAVLGQDVVLYGTQATLLRVRADQLVQRVNLQLALGGSFDAPPAAKQGGLADPGAPKLAQVASRPPGTTVNDSNDTRRTRTP